MACEETKVGVGDGGCSDVCVCGGGVSWAGVVLVWSGCGSRVVGLVVACGDGVVVVVGPGLVLELVFDSVGSSGGWGGWLRVW